MLKRMLVVAAAGTAAIVASTQSASPTGTHTHVVPIARDDERAVRAGGHTTYTFALPAAECTITGRIDGISGGNRDFEAWVLDADEYGSWSAGGPAGGMASGRRAAWSFSARRRGPGTFHLVVSNAFSVLSDKVVSTSAEASCGP